MPHRDLSATACLVVAALSLSSGAHAELGGPLASVESDRGRMNAQLASVSMGGYARHALTRANGGTVHEMTNADGQVFAVTWSGPGKPDLRALLGSHFAIFQAASGGTGSSGTAGGVGRAMHSLRRPPQVNEADLQIQAEGHMGWFRGMALIPSLAPTGFVASDLSKEP